MLELERISVARQGRSLFKPCSLTVESGRVGTIMGPSGLGKTSLLHALVKPEPGLTLEGVIRLDGVERSAEGPLLGCAHTVFQEPMLFPHLSVGANMALPIHTKPLSAQRAAVNDMLARLELPDLADADPMTLSRGQQMRVSLGRALIGRPRVLLLDEPFSALDHGTRDRIKAWLYAEIAQQGVMGVLVTHQVEDRPVHGEMTCLMPHSSHD